MAYKSGADGVAKQGKTKGRNLGDSGPNVAIENGPKSTGSKGGKSNMDMKTMGRGLAKIAAQKKG
jgi:ketol-acid reductoisomerase